MGYLLETFWLCLLLAALIGGIVGWLLRSWLCGRQMAGLQDDLDGANSRIRDLEAELAALRGQLSDAEANSSTLQARIGSLEGDLEGARADLGSAKAELGSATAAAAGAAASLAATSAALDDATAIDPDLALTSYPIEEIEGIGPGYGKRLRALGIATTEDMLVKGRTHDDRLKIAEDLDRRDIDVTTVTRWASMCDLCRLPGVRGQWAELLEFTSINSVQECSEQESSSLMTRLAGVNERENRVKELPSQDDLNEWIRYSGGLDQRIWFSEDHVRAEAEAALDSYPIEEVEGIGPGYGRALREQGIATTMDLVQKGRTQAERDAIAKEMDKPQIDGSVVTKWTSMSDLMRIPGIMGQFSELLTFGGLDKVSQLSAMSAGDLMALIEKTEEEQNRVPELPTIDKVAEWVEGAKPLNDMIDV